MNSNLYCILKEFSEFEDPAIVLCDNEAVIQQKTYKEIAVLCRNVTEGLAEHICSNSGCIGLLMNHNVYLPSIIISLQKLGRSFTFLQAKYLDNSIKLLHINYILAFENIKHLDFTEVTRISVDDGKHLVMSKNNHFYEHPVDLEDIFCIVQTSGTTTSKEKSVRVPYNCIYKNVRSLNKIFRINSRDIVFWGTPLSFDPTLVELLLAILNRACLLIVPYKVYLNPLSLYRALFSVKNITFLQTVPSVFLRWDERCQEEILSNKKLRTLTFGGEAFPKSVLRFKRSNDLRLFNLYGITELSCWATVHEIRSESSEDDIPLGQNLEATIVEVRDDQGGSMEVGEGEIFVGSTSRVCYINDEKQRNTLLPIFRPTGDLAKIDKKLLFYLGRKNNTIKRFGHKVNLTELEQMIFKATELTNKCIWARKDSKLLCFILMRTDQGKSYTDKVLDKIRIKLIKVLPEAGYPDSFEILDKFPLTSHGKLDVRFLERRYLASGLSEGSRQDCESVLSRAWCKYLGLSLETLEDVKEFTFLELGGNSIGILQMISELKLNLGHDCLNKLSPLIFEKSYQELILFLKTSVHTPISDEGGICSRKRIKLDDQLKVLWTYDMKGCVDSGPLVFEKLEQVYIAVGSFSNIFAVLDESGTEIYKKVLPDSIQSTPTLSKCKNFLFVGCFNGSIYCIDFLGNRVLWEFNTDGIIASSSCLCRKGSAIVFGSYDKNVYCVLSEDGSALWKTKVDGNLPASPIVNKTTGNILVATSKGTVFYLNESGEVIWKTLLEIPVFGTPCILRSGEEIIIPTVKGFLFCLSAENGREMWKFGANGNVYSSLIPSENCVVFGCHDKNLYVLKTDSENCIVTGKVELDAKISSDVAVCKDQHYIIACANSGSLYILDFDSLSLIGSCKLPDETFSSPKCCNSKIFVGCRDNNLYCIEFDNK